MSEITIAIEAQVDIFFYTLITLLALPFFATPLIVGMNFVHHRKFRKKKKRSYLSLEEITSIFRQPGATTEELSAAANDFATYHPKLPKDSHTGTTKERFALYVVLLESLSQQANATKDMVVDLGNILIKSNPAFKTDFEKKLNAIIKKAKL